MGVYLKNGSYFIDYRFQGRRKREKIGTSKKLAETVLKKRKVQIAEGKFLDIQKQHKIKFSDLVDLYVEGYAKINRKSWKDCLTGQLNRLKNEFGEKYLYEITSYDVEKFKEKCVKEVSPATVNRALAILRAIFNKGIEWNKFEGKNPVIGIKFYKEQSRLRFLEKEEIKTLLDNATDYLKPIIIIALNTGMRRGEILNLKWHDIDIKREIVYLYDTKNGEKREIRMNKIVKDTIIKIKKHPNSPYVFYNRNGKPYKCIRTAFNNLCKKLKITDFRFHDLRHTFASHLVMSGVDLNTVRELLGHKSLEMTLRYSHLSPDHKKRALDVLAQQMSDTAPVAQRIERLPSEQNVAGSNPAGGNLNGRFLDTNRNTTSVTN